MQLILVKTRFCVEYLQECYIDVLHTIQIQAIYELKRNYILGFHYLQDIIIKTNKNKPLHKCITLCVVIQLNKVYIFE